MPTDKKYKQRHKELKSEMEAFFNEPEEYFDRQPDYLLDDETGKKYLDTFRVLTPEEKADSYPVLDGSLDEFYEFFKNEEE